MGLRVYVMLINFHKMTQIKGDSDYMRNSIRTFISYLHDVKKISKNTELSYERDLRKMADYFEAGGKLKVSELDAESLADYVEYLKSQGKKSSTVSRSIASMKAFFQYELDEHVIDEDITGLLKAPKIEKKAPVILSVEETEKLLSQPAGKTDKEIRDKAMLELLYATGIRVTELISMKLEDIDLDKDMVQVTSGGGRHREIPFGKVADDALKNYIGDVRNRMIGEGTEDTLFINCSGSPMSRQGFWKILKYYTRKAGIDVDITPHTLRHSFAAHMVHNGADLHAVQEMMGHSDISSTQIYVKMDDSLRTQYAKAHPRR